MQTLPKSTTTPHLRLVESGAPAPAPLGAWTILFGTLSASAGHGLFLAVALTRLRSFPSRAELGGTLECAALAWFVACLVLAPAAWLGRARFLAGSRTRARTLTGAALVLALGAFGFYLRAVALGG